MNGPDEEALEASIRARINLNRETIKRLACDAGIGEYADEFYSALSGFDFVTERILELIRLDREEYENREPSSEYAEFYTSDYERQWYLNYLVPRRPGSRRGHDTLLQLFHLLGLQWKALPKDKRPANWAPKFDELDGKPLNATAKFFLGVAKLFASYSGVHCRSVVERVRKTRNPEVRAKRKLQNKESQDRLRRKKAARRK